MTKKIHKITGSSSADDFGDGGYEYETACGLVYYVGPFDFLFEEKLHGDNLVRDDSYTCKNCRKRINAAKRKNNK